MHIIHKQQDNAKEILCMGHGSTRLKDCSRANEWSDEVCCMNDTITWWLYILMAICWCCERHCIMKSSKRATTQSWAQSISYMRQLIGMCWGSPAHHPELWWCCWGLLWCVKFLPGTFIHIIHAGDMFCYLICLDLQLGYYCWVFNGSSPWALVTGAWEFRALWIIRCSLVWVSSLQCSAWFQSSTIIQW